MNVDFVKDDYRFNARASVVIYNKDKTNGILAAQNMEYVAEANGLGVLYSGFFTMAANASRKIRYTDYVSPSFGLYGDLCFSIYENVGVSNILYATDCLDGNITRDMIVTSSNFVASTPGEFSVEAVVTNSKGDQSYIKLPLIVEDRSLSAPKIYLTKYLINIKKGEQPDYASMVRSIEDYSGNAIAPAVRVVSEVDPNNDGTYLVHYYASDTEGYEGHSVLTVIVGN